MLALGILLPLLAVVVLVLWVSSNADIEGAQYDEALAAQATGAVMIEDQIDYTDASYLERQDGEE